MSSRSELLRHVMSQTGTTQMRLSRLSGVHQPSISQFLSGKVELSDDQLDRLLSCMGYQLEVERRAIVPHLTHAEARSWELHRQLATHLTRDTLTEWLPTIEANLERERSSVRGNRHLDHVSRWEALVETRDIRGLRRAMTGVDREAIEMREVSPLGGLLPNAERLEILHGIRRAG